MNAILGWRVKTILSGFAVILVAGAVFLTVQLASGDPTPPPPAGIDVTPPPQPPPSPGIIPEQAVDQGSDQAEAPPLLVNGVEVPVPQGATLGVVAGGYPGEGGPTQGIYRGGSYVLFNTQGVLKAEVTAEDRADFEPTLNALEVAAESASR